MSKDILKHLNKDQRKAVKYTEGHILILAGAGSGKTRVLTHKVAYLILEKKIPAQNILMVTFTNKAAQEMKERIYKLIGDSSHNIHFPFMGTFHAFCAKTLRINGRILNINPNYLIYDETDKKAAIKEVIKNISLDDRNINISSVMSTISAAKNELIGPLEYLNLARGSLQQNTAKIYLKYQRFLTKNNAVDFDDLIFKTVELLFKDENTFLNLSNRFQYILVDEYQDTNRAQYVLTKLLAKRWGNLTVVGDASQSIYNFRGADFRNVNYFQKDFPDVKVFNLEQNYRSTQNILDTAFSIINKNKSHPILKLWTEKPQGDKVIICEAENEQEESNFIINEAIKLKSAYQNRHYSDIAVLYRTNAQSRVIEESLLKVGIPYELVGGFRFYERKEIKDVLSYLRALHNPKDSVSLKRIEKLGKRRMKKFITFQNEFINNKNMQKLPTVNLLDEVLKKTGYIEKYDREKEEDSIRLENIKELYSVASQFATLSKFLENVSLVEQKYYPDLAIKEKKEAIMLMTVHAAKGLEFDYIFMAGMEEGLFPHSKATMDNNDLEEERRLCYVGITRARKKLYFTYAKQRLIFGHRNYTQISRFINNIPVELISKI